MLTKESELATLQSNLILQEKELNNEKISLEKKIKSLEDEKVQWKQESENSTNSMTKQLSDKLREAAQKESELAKQK